MTEDETLAKVKRYAFSLNDCRLFHEAKVWVARRDHDPYCILPRIVIRHRVTDRASGKKWACSQYLDSEQERLIMDMSVKELRLFLHGIEVAAKSRAEEAIKEALKQKN